MVIIDRPNPKDCEHCWNHFDCDEYRNISGFKSENCPIRAIPSGNYKLINTDLIKKSMVKFSFSVLEWINEVDLSNALIDIKRK